MKFKRGKVVGFKVGVYGDCVAPESKPASNSCVFATRKEAEQAGVELLSRWFAPSGFRVVEQTKEKPNYVFDRSLGRPRTMTANEALHVQVAIDEHTAKLDTETDAKCPSNVVFVEQRANEVREEICTPERLRHMTIGNIAQFIESDWKNVKYSARPYLDAMHSLQSINDMYGYDDAHSIVRYFLSNASSWRGPVARAVKAELKRRLGV